MKFLLPLAVVALVCSLTESRIATKCELKTKLENTISLPERLQKYKEQILATVVCEVERKSKLDTSLVTVDGERKSDETVVEAKTPAGPSQPGVDPTSDAPMRRRRDGRRKSHKGSEESHTMESHSEESNSTALPSTVGHHENHSMEASHEKHRGKSRGRRSQMPEEPEKTELQESLADILIDEEMKFNEEELMDDDNHLEVEKDPKGKIRARRGAARKIKRSEESDDFMPEQKFVLWSVGYYGVFQLSDSHFCDSGYRWSRNVCKASCSAFTDDDITDDVDCFVKSGYWRFVLSRPSDHCKTAIKNYFADC